MTKLADSVLVSMNNGAAFDVGTILYDSILPISRITSDILAYTTEGQCYVLEEYA